MMKKHSAVIGVFAGIVLALGLVSQFSSQPTKPSRIGGNQNIIFITVDTLRADHTPFGHYERDTMPYTADFFKEGINFVNAHTVRSKTVPAYSSMFTGLYPFHNGVRNNYTRLNDHLETLPEQLREYGYRTVGFVSSFAMIGQFSGLNQGFQIYDDYVFEKEITRENYERTAANNVNEVFKWLKRRNKNEPFFLFLHFIDPHGPYHPPSPYDKKFDSPKEKILSRNQIPDPQFIPETLDMYQYIDWYDGEIFYLDSELNRLYQALKEFEQNSWILFTADHGESLGDHGVFFSHGNNCYESETRIPMVWLPPSSLRTKYAARTSKDSVSLVDIFPTIMDLLQINTENKGDGESLVNAFSGIHLKKPYRFIEHVLGGKRVLASVDSRYKFIKEYTYVPRAWPLNLLPLYKAQIASEELYELGPDESEKRNRFNVKSMQKETADMLDDFFETAEHYRVPFVVEKVKPKGKEVTEFVVGRMKSRHYELSKEDQEKLKALGYVND
jgi:arylsulfatase A-like enzyme